jgi:hypothetical protein
MELYTFHQPKASTRYYKTLTTMALKMSIQIPSMKAIHTLSKATTCVRLHAVNARKKIRSMEQTIQDLQRQQTHENEVWARCNRFLQVSDPGRLESRASMETNRLVLAHAENTKKTIQTIGQTIRDLQRQRVHEEQALFLFQEYLTLVRSKSVQVHHTSRDRFDFFHYLDMDYFQPILATYGLKILEKKYHNFDIMVDLDHI